MAAGDKRVPVLLGTHNINTYDSNRNPVRTEAKAISLMTDRVRSGLNLNEASPTDLEGVEIDTQDNGSYFSEVLGSVSAQKITVIRDVLTPRGINRTFSFSCPNFFPNYKIRQLLQGIDGIVAFKRNGKRIFVRSN